MEEHIRLPFFPLFFVALMVMLSHQTDSALALPAPSTGKIQRDGDHGGMSLFFIPNQGQFDRQVAYAVQGKDKSIYFTAQGLTFVLTEKVGTPSSAEPRTLREITPQKPEPQAPQKRWVVKLDFVGANHHVLPESLDQAETVVSYFKGKPRDWKTGLQTSSKIIYHNLWPGIDLVYYGTVNRLKYEFIVHPGADPAQIRLAYRGADKVQVTKEGRLEVTTPLDVVRDETPAAWQENDGKKTGVSVAYALNMTAGIKVAGLSTGKSDAGGIIPSIHPRHEGHVYGFTVGDYDRTKILILDPEMLVYCGFIGGSGGDGGGGIAVDDAGNAYVTGATINSTEATFPVKVGPDLTYNGGDYDAFVAKVNSAGTALVYCGYIGGSGGDGGGGIAVDVAGNAYVTGMTDSTEATFPVTTGPDTTYNGVYSDAFVAKIAPAPDAPVANFTAAPTSGPSPLSVSFSDQSTGVVTSWSWDFDNNGSVDSTVQNPTRMYVAAGSFTVTLTVNGPGGSDSITRASYIVVTEVAADADNDGLPDNWEVVYFGNTTAANRYTDWDRDGYTDLQEYLNQLNSEKDPAGGEYDPKTVNAPGGTGYVDSDFWSLMIPVITAGRRCAAIPNGNFESGNTAWGEYSELGYEIITKAFPAGVLPHNGSYAAWLGGADNELSLIVQRLPIPSSCSFLTFYHWIDSSDYCGYDFGLVIINETLVGTYQLCAARNTGGWRVQSIDLSAYAGQTVDLIIAAVTDESILSSWYIDDVSFQASAQ